MCHIFYLFSLFTSQVRWVPPRRCSPRPTWVFDAVGRSRESARCTAMPLEAKWPQREIWWPGVAGFLSPSLKKPPSGNSCTHLPTQTHFHTRGHIVFDAWWTLWSVCLPCRKQVNWREAKGEEEINIYQSERRRRTLHSLPKESRVSSLAWLFNRNMTIFFF